MSAALGKKLRAEQIWLVLLGALVLAALIGAFVMTLNIYKRSVNTLEEISPRYARITGVMQQQADIDKVRQELSENVSQYVYPMEGDANQIGNQVLQKIRDLANANHLQVSSIQSKSTKADADNQGFDRIELDLRIEGDWNQLAQLLTQLPKERPAIYQNSLQLMGMNWARTRDGKGPVNVSAQFDLFVLKLHKAGAQGEPGKAAGATGTERSKAGVL